MSSGERKRIRKMMRAKTCTCLIVPLEEATFFPSCGWLHNRCQGRIQNHSKVFSAKARRLTADEKG